MKTYQEYFNEWQNSAESRDLAFEEWLMLQLARKEKEMIDKACEAFCEHACMCSKPCSPTCDAIRNVRKALEE